MTADIDFYVRLAREADGPLVELAVGNGRVAIPVGRATGRRVIGLDSSPAMLEQARERATEAGVDLELHLADMRDLRLDEPAALIYCPFRALLHLPTWADRRLVFERVAAALLPGGRFAWNAFAFDHRVATRLDGIHQESPVPHTVRYTVGIEPRRHRPGRRLSQLALVGDEERVARPHRRRRPRAGGARRRVRRRALRRRQHRVRVRLLVDERRDATSASSIDPDAHEPVTDAAWDADRARAAVARDRLPRRRRRSTRTASGPRIRSTRSRTSRRSAASRRSTSARPG